MWGGHSCPPPLKLLLRFEDRSQCSVLALHERDARAYIPNNPKSGGQECPPQTGYSPFSFFFILVVQIEPERGMLARAGNFNGQLGLPVLAEEWIKRFQDK